MNRVFTPPPSGMHTFDHTMRSQGPIPVSDRPYIIQAFYVLCASVLFKVVWHSMELTLQVFAVYQTPIVWAFLVSIPVRYLVSWLDYVLSSVDHETDEDDKCPATPRKRKRRNRKRKTQRQHVQNLKLVFAKKESDWLFEWLFWAWLAWAGWRNFGTAILMLGVLLLLLWCTCSVAAGLCEYFTSRTVHISASTIAQHLLKGYKNLKDGVLAFVSRRKRLRAVVKAVLLVSVIGIMTASVLWLLISISDEARILREKAFSVKKLWPALNPELTLSAIGSGVTSHPHPLQLVSSGKGPAVLNEWQLPHMYYITRYSVQGCAHDQPPLCGFPDVCPDLLRHYRWALEGKHSDSESWALLHESNTSASTGSEQEPEQDLNSVSAIRVVFHGSSSYDNSSSRSRAVCLEALEVWGKFDVHYNLWMGLAEYWNQTKASSPVLRVLGQIVEHGQMHLHKAEVDKRSENALKSCEDRLSICTKGGWISLECARSLPASILNCVRSVRELISQEFEVLSWVNWAQIQEMGSRFLLESVVGGALRLFGTAFGLMWNLFMFCLDLWVFLVVFVSLVFSEEGILPWVLSSFTTLENSTVQQITLVCTRDIHGVFVSLAKIAMFHSAFSWFSVVVFNLDFPCTTGLLSGLACLIDERLVLLCLIPAAVQLWVDDRWAAYTSKLPLPFDLNTMCFWGFISFNLWRCLGGVGANIFRSNTPDLHPMIIGWSVFGGLSLFGASGAITGPMVATLPFTFRDLFQLYKLWVMQEAPHPGSPGGISPMCVPQRLFNESQGPSADEGTSPSAGSEPTGFRLASFRDLSKNRTESSSPDDSPTMPPGYEIANAVSASRSVFGTPSSRSASTSVRWGSVEARPSCEPCESPGLATGARMRTPNLGNLETLLED